MDVVSGKFLPWSMLCGLCNVKCFTDLFHLEARGPSFIAPYPSVVGCLGERGDDISPNFLGKIAHPIAIVQRRSQIEASSSCTCSSWEMHVRASEGDLERSLITQSLLNIQRARPGPDMITSGLKPQCGII